MTDVIATCCPNLKKLTLISEELTKQVTDQGLMKFIQVTLNNSQLESIDILNLAVGLTIASVSKLQDLPNLRSMSLNLRQLTLSEDLPRERNRSIKSLRLFSSWDDSINSILPAVNEMFPTVSSLVLQNRITGQQVLPNWEQSVRFFECQIGKSSDLNHVFAIFPRLDNFRTSVPNLTLFSEFFEIPPTLNIRRIELNIGCALFRDQTPDCNTVNMWLSRFSWNVKFKFRVKSDREEMWKRFISELNNIRETRMPIEIEHLD